MDDVTGILEIRHCDCGCSRSFRVLDTSKQRYASRWCEVEHQPARFKRGVRIAKKVPPRMDIIAAVERSELLQLVQMAGAS